MPTLPIESALPELRRVLAAGTAAVLQAPPGAGKTTRVPLALLDEAWLSGTKIVMLEPRRLAARAAARHMAGMLREEVGGTVGYRVRLDTKVSARTRIEVVTEGVLTRMLQDDASLDGVGLLVFDEFHERSLPADLGLALALESQAVLRPELRILVMSATLAAEPVARLLNDAPVVRSEGRSYPVELRYAATPRERGTRIEGPVAAATRTALAESEGDVLVLLPGAGEIRRTAELLSSGLPANVHVIPLHGMLPQAQQDEAIRPSVAGRRKVVLATSIAETSLTIEGVRAVIDSGLSRVPRFSPRTGMTRLETERVTRDAADQRAGRAGRLAPGVCWRLWPEGEHATLTAHRRPEILDADLAPVALELAAAGITDPLTLRWLDAPPAAAFAHARDLLLQLGALDAAGRITAHGRRMARLPLHPRLAHMIVAAGDAERTALACDLAALLEERDILRGEGRAPDPDLRLRLAALRGASIGLGSGIVDRDAVRRVREEATALRRAIGARSAANSEAAEAHAGSLLALAYPDRIAQRRANGGRYLLRNGRGAALDASTLTDAPYLVAADLDDRGTEGRILLAAPVDLDELERELADEIVREEEVAWDATARAARGRVRERLGALILSEAPLRDPSPTAVVDALLNALTAEGLSLLSWSDAARQTRDRLAFAHRLDARWPDVSDAALVASAREWLAPNLAGARSFAEVDVAGALLSLLDWKQRAKLDEIAPARLEVPSGSWIAMDYSDPDAPVLAVKLQEMFGLKETPRVGDGAVPVVLHLLSPAGRPVQVTRDLGGFWKNSYFEVRKDLRGRYPKHPWPDDPLAAAPTRRAKRRGE